MPTGKPQYRTLVKALDELALSALFVLRNAPNDLLGGGHLRHHVENSAEVVQRARDAMDEKARKKDADKRP